MAHLRLIVVIFLAVALTAYVVDCEGITTQQQAMQCCNEMPCNFQGHTSQDCCKSMQSLHAPFVQTSSVQSVLLPLVALAEMPTRACIHDLGSCISVTVEQSHAPPVLSPPVQKP